ncbi:MAG TPA: amino acid adenylation domain-containing protein, partial [Pyrinomonadaceae bacterium]|nr:amino acid adenylation domain-containing protein [Pyrinomonadaceae bacterium]
MSLTERQQLLLEWNESSAAYPRESCIHELFEAQVRRTPEALAVVFQQQQLTYAELNKRANQLAHHLRSLGVGAETLVGLCVERSLEMVIGLLGILKGGGAYVPLDPEYPAERLSFMLEDAGIPVLLTQQHLVEELPSHWALTLTLDSDWPELAGNPATNPNWVAMQPENLAYVSYTSGSTGRPKGVSVPHGAVVSLLCPAEFVRLDEGETVLQMAPLAFDASTFEVWGSLLNGARLVVMPAGQATLEEIGAVVQQQRVTTLWLTAGLFHLMVDEQLAALVEVRQLLAGGDVLSVEHSRRYLAAAGAGSVLVNGYGPTESTTFTSCEVLRGAGELAGETSVAIGKVVGGRRAYVLDEQGELVGRGIWGELYIGGAGLGRGYVQRAAETAERFVPDGWSGEWGGRLYRTGDVVRWKGEGKLEFKGRADGQVKLRGYRIELGEIEAVLGSHPRVSRAVVVALADEAGEKRLVGYVVLADEAATEVEELREYLAQRLPSYMVPRVLMPLNTLPLTNNGKVDRAALPAPPSLNAERSDTADKQQTAIEEMLGGVWSEVLKIERAGVRDNFFDLGGHSLLATQVFSRIREVFAVEISLRSLFENPTIAELAVVVEIALRAAEGVEAPPIKRRPQGQKIPLSYAQQRLWFLDRLEPGSAFYNVPLAVRLRGQLNIEALERTLNEVMRRHEVLRTTFRSSEAEPEQIIHEALELKLEVEPVLAGEQDQLAEVRRLSKEESGRGFDLTEGPLLRVRLLRLAEEEHVVLLTMHHVVSDGWSMGVLTNEIAALYRAFSAGEEAALPEMPIQYADYAVWQREWLNGDVLAGELDYWRKHLGGQLPTLNLPTDRPRPTVPTYRGAYHGFALPVDLSEKVKQLGRDQGCTLFMTLMAAFKTLLFRYSGQDDIIVGTIVANRNSAEIEPLIGLFINTLAIRTDLSGDPTFIELMARVKENMLTAHVHQDVPFEKLVSELQ